MTFYTPGGAPQVSDVSATSLLFLRTFEGAVVPTETFNQNVTGMASALSNGLYVLNSGADTTPGDHIEILSRRTFPLFAIDSTVAEFWLQTSGDAQDGLSTWGLQSPSLAGGAAAVDGVYFRLIAGATFAGSLATDATVQLQAVVSVNGTETIMVLAKGAANLPGAGTHRYRIEVRHNTVIFSVDERAPMSIDISGLILPANTCTQPVGFCVSNGTPVSARSLSVGLVAVYSRSTQLGRAWGHAMAGNGLGAYQQPPGTATGQTASFANNAVAAAFTPANNGTGALNNLGGQYQINATATAESDLAIFAYANPAASGTVAGRTLYVTGIRIGEIIVQGVAVATLTTMQFGCGVGSSASLAVSDSTGSFSYRKHALGMTTHAALAPVGTIAPGLPWADFSQAPMVVPPGARFGVFVKVLNGAATGSLVFRGTVAIAGYFE